MPVITRQVFANGGNQTVTVTVTGDFAYSDIDERMIVETVLEGVGSLHQSAKIQKAPVGMIGYIHNKAENTLWAVTALDSAGLTITIAKQGQTKNNVHRF